MKKKEITPLFIAVPLLLALLAACSHKGSEQPLPTQSGVDLKRYAGTWYEQARLPNSFQDHCVGQARADYELIGDDRLEVVNRCENKEGNVDAAVGVGRVARSSEPDPAILEIRFAPAWTSWLPAVWGDYWIISTDYEYSLVGTPDRKYLWVLSRDTEASSARVNELLQTAEKLGFDTGAVIRPEKSKQ